MLGQLLATRRGALERHQQTRLHLRLGAVELDCGQAIPQLHRLVAERRHEFGRFVLAVGEPHYEIIRSWIADGARLDLTTPRVTRIEVFPVNPVVQRLGTRQQLRVLATRHPVAVIAPIAWTEEWAARRARNVSLPRGRRVSVDGITDRAADVRWTTNEPATRKVTYGPSVPPDTIVTNDFLLTSHTVHLTGLSECGRVYFSVGSADALSQSSVADNGGQFFSFVVGTGTFTGAFPSGSGQRSGSFVSLLTTVRNTIRSPAPTRNGYVPPFPQGGSLARVSIAQAKAAANVRAKSLVISHARTINRDRLHDAVMELLAHDSLVDRNR